MRATRARPSAPARWPEVTRMAGEFWRASSHTGRRARPLPDKLKRPAISRENPGSASLLSRLRDWTSQRSTYCREGPAPRGRGPYPLVRKITLPPGQRRQAAALGPSAHNTRYARSTGEQRSGNQHQPNGHNSVHYATLFIARKAPSHAR